MILIWIWKYILLGSFQTQTFYVIILRVALTLVIASLCCSPRSPKLARSPTPPAPPQPLPRQAFLMHARDYCHFLHFCTRLHAHPALSPTHSWRSPPLARAQRVSDVCQIQWYRQGTTASTLLQTHPEVARAACAGTKWAALLQTANSVPQPRRKSLGRGSHLNRGSYLLCGVAPQTHGVGDVWVYLCPVATPFYPLQHLQAAQEHPAIQGTGWHGDLGAQARAREESVGGSTYARSPSFAPPSSYPVSAKLQQRETGPVQQSTYGRKGAICVQILYLVSYFWWYWVTWQGYNLQ